MPGPMMACDKSTGATGECLGARPSCPLAGETPALPVISSSASGKVALSSRRNSRRLTVGASAGRLRQTRTMLEASALVPEPIMRLPSSVRIGQVPVRAKPACSTASKNVSQPVLEVSRSVGVSPACGPEARAPCVSLCLKA